MQGERGSLLELQRYHRGQQHHSPSRGPNGEDGANDSDESGSGECNDAAAAAGGSSSEQLLQLKALQARLLASAAAAAAASAVQPQPSAAAAGQPHPQPPISMRRGRSGRRHTLANLGR